MTLAHEQLTGLDRDRVVAVVEPILRAHEVEGVELAWKTDRSGWVLALTVERPGSSVPGEGVTIDLCTDISRDLSAALDAADLIAQAYRLEVGSPGVERALYTLEDYRRFAGRGAKLKLEEPRDGQWVIVGRLSGVSESKQVLLETDTGLEAVALQEIERAHLLFEWSNRGSRAQRLGKKAGSAGSRNKNKSGGKHARSRRSK